MTRLLQCDDQTLSDLGIFGRPGKASVLSVFDRTVTEGGKELLRALFHKPLADMEAINARAALLSFFSEQGLGFPVNGEDINAAAYYMDNHDPRSRIEAEAGKLGQRLERMVAADAGYLFVKDGVGAFLRCYSAFQEFIREREAVFLRSPFNAAFCELRGFISQPAMDKVAKAAVLKKDPDRAMLAELDQYIRFDHRQEVLQLMNWLFDLDVWITVGNVARDMGFCFGVAVDGLQEGFGCTGVYHPLVERAVPNDMVLTADRNMLFLTGANMAGKSTLMKAIGITLYLAHMGFPLPAAAVRFAVKDRLVTSINLSDNLSSGASHYFAEVLRVKEVAGALQRGERLMVIFDELFKGTNVTDAFEATTAIARAFCEFSSSQFVISTHIIEAGELLRTEEWPILFSYLPTELLNGAPVYKRVLGAGISKDRHGMIIVENEGVFDMLGKGEQRVESAAAPFLADRQTMDDLNIAGKFKAGSLFNLFNRVQTHGGEMALQEFFERPLVDAAAIQDRMDQIRYIQGRGMYFIIDREKVELASQLLYESRSTGLAGSCIRVFTDRIKQIAVHADGYERTFKQVQAVRYVLVIAAELLQKMDESTKKHPCAELIGKLKIATNEELYADGHDVRHGVWQQVKYHYLLLHKYRKQVEDMLQALYQLDAYVSVAKVASEKKLIYPRIDVEGHVFVDTKGLRHPSMAGAKGNDIRLDRGQHLFFLTGANMAGKSTLMKTISASVYLAHMGFPVAADAFSFSVMDGIYTSINVPDDIAAGWSHFYAEVMRVKEVARQVSAGKRLLVVFDELFKGTNVKDAFDGTLRVIKSLTGYERCAFIISTHIIEVAEELKDSEGIQFGYMPTIMEGGRPAYTYELTPGVTRDKHGMLLLQNEEIFDMLNISI